MSYLKQTWQNLPSTATPVNAQRLNHIEDGIYQADQTAEASATVAQQADTKATDASNVANQTADGLAQLVSQNLASQSYVNSAIDGAVDLRIKPSYVETMNVRTVTELFNALGQISAGSTKRGITIPSDVTITTDRTIELPWLCVEFVINGTLIIRGRSVTGATAATDTITSVNHGMKWGTRIRFTNVGTATTIAVGDRYIITNVTADSFKIAASPGATPLTIGTATGISFDIDVVGITKNGTVGSASQKTSTGVSANSRSIPVNNADGINVNDWIFVLSNDTLSGTGDKIGYMKKVNGVAADSLSISSAIPRNMTSNVRVKQLNLAPSVHIHGTGMVTYEDPVACAASMIRFEWVEAPRVSAPLRLYNGGGTAVSVSHCPDGYATPYIELMQDIGGNTGYGVSLNGASPNFYHGGVVTRVRHAFTTNMAANEVYNFYGEPENWVCEAVAVATRDKPYDTHRAGWGGTFRTNALGGGGGVQVRADNVYVEGRFDGTLSGDLIRVWNYVQFPPTFGAIHSVNHSGNGIVLESPARFTAFPTFINLSGTPLTVSAGVYYTIGDTARVTKSADQSVSSANTGTTLVDVTEMSFPVEANATYELTGHLITRASQAGDLNFGWSVPANATLSWTSDGVSNGATSTGASINRSSGSESSTQAIGGVGTPATIMRPGGYLVTGNTSGTLQLRFAQLTADATSSTVLAGSRLALKRIG